MMLLNGILGYFIKDLILVGKVRNYPIRVGVIANRVKKESPVYLPLIKFLSHLDIPFITMLWYVKSNIAEC